MTKQEKKKLIPALIMLASAAIRAYYVSYISVYVNQHDGGAPYHEGQLGYITWYLANGRLPDFDVSKVDQFWHPPLHYAVSAGFLRLVWNIFPAMEGNFEPLQILPFIYVTLTIYIIWKILKLFAGEGENEQKEPWLYFVLAFVAFQPGLVIRSASINNDALILMMTILTFYLALLWHDEGKWWQIFAIAFSMGLALMTKKSAALLAVPLAILGLGRLYEQVKREDWQQVRTLLIQAVVFLSIAAPIGLWWYLRNLIVYGVPLNFFWNIEKGWEYDEYLGNIPMAQRLFTFDIRSFAYTNTYLQYKTTGLQDFNPMVALLKTAVSDVWSWSYVDGGIKQLSYMMLIARTTLVVIGAISIPSFALESRGIINKGLHEGLRRWAIIAFFIAQIVSYHVFCFDYPYVWTMDYRYIEAIIMCDGVFLAAGIARWNKCKRIVVALEVVISFFCVLAFGFFVLWNRFK